MLFIRLSIHRFLDRLAYVRIRLTSVSSMYMLLNTSLVINICSTVAWCSPLPQWYFTIFYFQCFSAGRSPASLLLVCVPPRPTAAWLLLRSVVPYHSLFLLLLLRPGRQVRLLFLSTSFALSWLPISRSAKSFSDRLF